MPVLEGCSTIRINVHEAAGAQEHTFETNYKAQEQTMWCWASCAHMILYAIDHTNNKSQCEIVNWALSRADCCSDSGAAGDTSKCDQGIYTVKGGNPGNDHLDVWSHFGSLTADHVFAEVPFADIKTQTANNQPLEVCWVWDTGGSHVVVLYGWREENGTQSVYVADPDSDYGQGAIEYSEVENARNLGSWAETFTNIRKKPHA